MPARLRVEQPEVVAAALGRVRRPTPDPVDLRLLVKHFLAVLADRAPGRAVEVRVPPFAAVQVIGGTTHTRGTPPAVVEADPQTWIALATGELTWAEADKDGRIVASGERSDLNSYLPLT